MGGGDFLLKIWKQIASVPLCIAIYDNEVKDTTQYNIFYELGVAQTMGKENIIIKSKQSKIPSDFVRSEYIEFNNNFSDNFNDFFVQLKERAEFYEDMSKTTEKNPLLAIDFLKRAFLITENEKLRSEAKKIIIESFPENTRAKNSVEMILASF